VRVAVIDHGMGNLRSVGRALEASGASVMVSSSAAEVCAADALCVPGQGVFGRCVDNLRAAGLAEVIGRWVEQERPFLGICLGLQVLFESSEEGGAGLGLFGGRVERLKPPAGAIDVSVPHIGWNEVAGEHFYFDHSYAVRPDDDALVTGWCDHGERVVARIERGPLLAVQFHPEKSAAAGLALLRRWVAA
jgi:imidazole glycerol-phosphate synthase subunit HisH